ncbi:hypothetical protein [Stenotrophomonas maltophilia]|uniref:hypothetical protein n=1 Tax=Stenotrophomonas maltophilia TaxID=40324 RepID=UPI001C609DA1|nr:hypothetical protein [Stenotrophomonas maltophilia]
MTTDNKTLADARPGGRVRLGDGLRSELLEQAERLERMAAQDRETGESIEQALEAGEEYTPDDAPDVAAGLQHDANRSEEVAALLRKAAAALSAQPSPGGQGAAGLNALAASIGEVAHRLSTYMPHLSEWADRARDCKKAADVLSAVAARQPVGDQHPDDLAVDAFAAAMKAKMAEARAKGRGGWEDPAQCTADDLSRMLRDHVEKGDPRDVANFCMMLHQRGESISARQPATQPDSVALGEATEFCIEKGDRQPLGEPVALVGADFDLFWIGSGPIAPLVERNGLRPGSNLYALPAQAVDLGQLQRFDHQLFENPWPHSGMEDAVEGDWVRFDDVLALIDSKAGVIRG